MCDSKTSLKKQFQGLCTNRFDRNPDEKRWAEAWQRANEPLGPGDGYDLLTYLLDPENQQFPREPSEEEYKVAATVIQWLGSPIGEDFVRCVLEERTAIEGTARSKRGMDGEDK